MDCIITEKQSNQINTIWSDDETKKMTHDSLIVRTKENLKLSHGGPRQNEYQAPTNGLKLHVKVVIESEA